MRTLSAARNSPLHANSLNLNAWALHCTTLVFIYFKLISYTSIHSIHQFSISSQATLALPLFQLSFKRSQIVRSVMPLVQKLITFGGVLDFFLSSVVTFLIVAFSYHCREDVFFDPHTTILFNTNSFLLTLPHSHNTFYSNHKYFMKRNRFEVFALSYLGVDFNQN